MTSLRRVVEGSNIWISFQRITSVWKIVLLIKMLTNDSAFCFHSENSFISIVVWSLINNFRWNHRWKLLRRHLRLISLWKINSAFEFAASGCGAINLPPRRRFKSFWLQSGLSSPRFEGIVGLSGICCWWCGVKIKSKRFSREKRLRFYLLTNNVTESLLKAFIVMKKKNNSLWFPCTKIFLTKNTSTFKNDYSYLVNPTIGALSSSFNQSAAEIHRKFSVFVCSLYQL